MLKCFHLIQIWIWDYSPNSDEKQRDQRFILRLTGVTERQICKYALKKSWSRKRVLRKRKRADIRELTREQLLLNSTAHWHMRPAVRQTHRHRHTRSTQNIPSSLHSSLFTLDTNLSSPRSLVLGGQNPLEAANGKANGKVYRRRRKSRNEREIRHQLLFKIYIKKKNT